MISLEGGESIPMLNDIFERGMQGFLIQAEAELREQGLDESVIRRFSEIFQERFRTEYQLLAEANRTPTDLQEHVDDALRLAISDIKITIKDEGLNKAASSLWGLRAEDGLEQLEKKEKMQGKDNTVEFRKKD